MRLVRILLVEDDVAVREMLCEGLREEGFEVVPAANGVEASELFAALGPYDLLLLDDDTPRLTGRQFLATVRAAGSAVAAVFHSGDLVLSEAERASLGVGPVLPKPATVAEVARTIRAALRQPPLAP